MGNTGLKSNEKEWIKRYQLAVNEIIQSLGGEDAVQEKYGEVADAWNEAEPPEELKRK